MSQNTDAPHPRLSETADAGAPPPERNLLEVLAEMEELPIERQRQRLEELGLAAAEREQVQKWLAAQGKAPAGFLEQAPAAARDVMARLPVPGRPGPPPADAPKSIGPYRLLEVIGQGGMGTVYKAEQRSPVKRIVALKLVKPGFDTTEVIARFHSERQALARMDHPHVAKVLDAGADELGRPYFVMEYVPGAPITAFADEHKLSVRQRLELFIQVCEAIAHAHTKAIIHRDIKASNVLAYVADGKATVKVIDFGVAKALTGERLADQTLNTQRGQVMGTYAYMSPEQAEGSPDIDTRTDVYSLGVLLYELLTGAMPFDRATLAKAAHEEIRRIIREVEPPRPSSRLSTPEAATAGAAGRRDTRLIQKEIAGDLDWVVLKTLEKDRSRRYETANGLAADLRRHLVGEPVLAAPPSKLYRAGKFVKRNKGAAIAAALVVAALVLGIIGTAAGLVRAESRRKEAVKATENESSERQKAQSERQKAQKERDKAKVYAEFMETTLSGVDPGTARGRDTTMLREMMDAAAERIDSGQLKDDPEAEIRLRETIGGVYARIAEFDRAERMLATALQEARRLSSGDSETLATALNQMGWLRSQYQGRYADGLALSNESLAMRQRLSPGDNWNSATSLNNVAWCLEGMGQEAEALQKHETALAMRQRLFKGDHPDTFADISNVTRCLVDMGRLEEALPKCQAALQMAQRLYKGDHPNIASSLNGLGICLIMMGRPAEALPVVQAALEMQQRLFKGDHPDVASGFHSVSRCLLDLGRPEEALPKSQAALQMQQRLFKGDHPDVALMLGQIARCLDSMGRHEEALTSFKAAVEMEQRLFKGDHPEIAVDLVNMASCLQSLGRSEEAASAARRAMAMCKAHPDWKPGVADSAASWLSVILRAQGAATARTPSTTTSTASAILRAPGAASPITASMGAIWARSVQEFQARHPEVFAVEAGPETPPATTAALAPPETQPYAARLPRQPATEPAAAPRLLLRDAWRPAWSADGSAMLYARPGAEGGIASLDLKTSKTRVILDEGKDAAWSPDGSQILFVKAGPSGTELSEEVWLCDAGGQSRRRLAYGGFASWSQDGRDVVYHSRRENKVMAASVLSPTEQARVLYERPNSWYPAVSRDLSQIAFGPRGTLMVFDCRSRATLIAVQIPGARGLLPDFSPDRTMVACGGFNTDRAGLWVINLSTRKAVEVLHGHFTAPAWSRDGTQLAFDHREGSKREVWVVGREYVADLLDKDGIPLPASE